MQSMGLCAVEAVGSYSSGLRMVRFARFGLVASGIAAGLLASRGSGRWNEGSSMITPDAVAVDT